MIYGCEVFPFGNFLQDLLGGLGTVPQTRLLIIVIQVNAQWYCYARSGNGPPDPPYLEPILYRRRCLLRGLSPIQASEAVIAAARLGRSLGTS